MSQQGNFSGGFIVGAIVGGVVGGVLGVVLATPRSAETAETADELNAAARPQRRRPLRLSTEPVTEQSMEVARQGLESKIAQLNEAIDDVRQQLGQVNGKSDVIAEKL